jgi:glutamate dehydrogenase (NAD(P)+)
VTVSYYEWVQNRNSEHWEVERVDEQLRHVMRRGYQRTMFFAEKHRVDPRTAAYGLALESLATSYAERGIFP